MSIEEAKERLTYHSGRNENVEDPKWVKGFLGSLRPFRGELIEDNFIEVMECMKVLQGEFEQDKIDRNMLSDIVGITYLARTWAAPYGMLGSNKLLSEEQTAKYFMENEAILTNDARYTIFKYGKYTIRFKSPYSLEKYTQVKEWDRGYLVVMAKYSHNEEEYIDLIPILENLYFNV